MASPASSATPTLSRRSDLITTSPSPPAPTSAAMMTMLSAIMIVWLTPARIEGSACGICTLKSICRGVEPKASAASMTSSATRRSPRLVRRTTGGTA